MDIPKTPWSKLLTIPCVFIGLPLTWLLLLDLGAKWADALSGAVRWLRSAVARRYPDVVSLHYRVTPSAAATTNQNGAHSVWTVERDAQAPLPIADAPGVDAPDPTCQWISTVLIIVHPFIGSFIFGMWGDLTLPLSLAVPLVSLLLVSPPMSSGLLLWRATFQVYLIIGWILVFSCCLLWWPSWRAIFRHWAHDLQLERRRETTYLSSGGRAPKTV